MVDIQTALAQLETAEGEGHLSPGAYELKIYGGKEGVERLKLVQQGGGPLLRAAQARSKAVSKSGCLIPEAKLEDRRSYRLDLNRTGSVTTRGLILREIPLGLRSPLPLVLDAGETLRLPVAAGGDVVIRAAGGGKFACWWQGANPTQARQGRCRLSKTTIYYHIYPHIILYYNSY